MSRSQSPGRATGLLRRYARGTRGATAIEYGIIMALMAITVITGASLVGQSLRTDFFDYVAAQFAAAVAGNS